MSLILLILFCGNSFAAKSRSIWGGGNSVKKVAADGYTMRQLRKVGVGVGVSGQHGVMGGQLEFNFFPETSFIAGFGMGSNYQTFNFQIKRMLGGSSFMPYATAGFTHWYSATKDSSFSSTEPDFLADKFLSAAERRGAFSENIIYPGIGFQYLQLDGDWAGSSLYAEILLFIDIDDLISAPTGSIGYMYYF